MQSLLLSFFGRGLAHTKHNFSFNDISKHKTFIKKRQYDDLDEKKGGQSYMPQSGQSYKNDAVTKTWKKNACTCNMRGNIILSWKFNKNATKQNTYIKWFTEIF